jgi:hypothetical protein
VSGAVRSKTAIFLVGGFAIAGALRIGFLASLSPNWDTEAYVETVRTLDSGGTLYRDTPRYNYSPVWAFVLRVLARIGEGSIPLHRLVGALLLLVDVATAWLVFRIGRDVLGRSAESAAGSALLFFANPVSVFVTGFHAQFDGLSIAFLLLAIWLEGRQPARRLGAAGALTGSLLVKHVTVFHPLVFARRRNGRGLPFFAALLPYAVFAASFLPYWSVRGTVFDRVLGYGSLAEDYGTAMLRGMPGVPEWAPKAFFFAAAAVAAFALRRIEPARASLLLFLVLLVFLPGVAEYYFAWPIALGSLFGGAGYAVFTLLVSAFFLGSPDGLGLPLTHLPGWHGVWWGAVFWLLWEMRKLSQEKSA